MKADMPAVTKRIDKGKQVVRRRYGIALPLKLASKLEALCELHPEKPRSQIVSDLLILGLAATDHASPTTTISAFGSHPDASQPIYLLTGPFAEFQGLVHKHYLALEQESAKDAAQNTPPVDDFSLGTEE